MVCARGREHWIHITGLCLSERRPGEEGSAPACGSLCDLEPSRGLPARLTKRLSSDSRLYRDFRALTLSDSQSL